MQAPSQKLVTTNRDCPARLVPVGTEITIPASTFLTITQALGGNYTVIYNGNMARIDGTDADAIGMPGITLSFDAATDGSINEEQLWEALSTIYDPEIPVNLVELGLIYKLQIDNSQHKVSIDMTLTAPGCGMGPVLVEDVRYRIAHVPNVQEIEVNLVFDPPWSRDMMSEAAQLETGMIW